MAGQVITVPGKRPKGSPELCSFGAGVLDHLYHGFTRQFEGVRAAADPDHIHDMRVASRRLRATLPIFRECFPAPEYRSWLKEIRRITRALGEARDKDVQIEFLRGKIANCTTTALLPGLEYLLLRLSKERRAVQPAVIKAIDRAQESTALHDLGSVLREGTVSPMQEEKTHHAPAIYKKARNNIRERLDALIVLETSLEDPEAIEGHHAMRIAAKRLRYTMEAYAPLYDGALDSPISTVKRVQELLGTLHDLDVWILQLPRVIDNEWENLLSVEATSTFSGTIEPGIQVLLDECRTERGMLFEEFVQIWAEHHRAGFFRQLGLLLDAERHCATQKRAGRKAGSIISAARIQTVIDIARGYHFEEQHSLHVTRLALSLFDQLAPLHGLCARERSWLQCAGILHDIGLAGGRKDHLQRSLQLILTDRDLPLRKKERMMIALVARYHGRDLPNPRQKEYGMLQEKEKTTIRILTALLRVADALDISHLGRISRIEIRIGTDTVMIGCAGSVPADEEQSAVAKKGNLFEQIFKKGLEVTWMPEP